MINCLLEQSIYKSIGLKIQAVDFLDFLCYVFIKITDVELDKSRIRRIFSAHSINGKPHGIQEIFHNESDDLEFF